MAFNYPTTMIGPDRPLDPSALTDWRDRPVEAAKCYFAAGALAFYPHDYNAKTRKIVTTIVVTGWIVLEILHATGFAQSTGLLVYLRPIVFLILGQMWGIEIVNMKTFGNEILPGGNGKDDSSNTDDDHEQ